MAIRSILRQISYSFKNTTCKFLSVNFVFVKKIKKGGTQAPSPLPPLAPFGSATGVLGNAPLGNFENVTHRSSDFLCF